MNIMTTTKKKLIKISIIFLVLGITILSIVLMNINNNKKCRFLNYPSNYSLCNTSELEVIIYANISDLECFKKENITNAVLEDIEENLYYVSIIDITIKDKIFIEDNNYYPYHLKLSLSFSSEFIIDMDNVKLIINNKSGDKLIFNIGNISVINNDFIQFADTKKITSTTKMIDEYYTIDTINIELCNKQYNSITLSNIILVSNVVNTVCNSVDIGVGEDYLLEVKLDYLIDGFIDHVGIILEWEVDDKIYQQLISPYRLFKTTSKHTKPVFQTYEVY